MSRLIGITYARDAHKAPACSALVCGELAAIFAPAGHNLAAIARDCLFALPAMLPIARGDPAVVESWIDRHACDLTDSLARVSGRCELNLSLTYPICAPPLPTTKGRDWLRARAAAAAADAAAGAHAESRLSAIRVLSGLDAPRCTADLRRRGETGRDMALLVSLAEHRAAADCLLEAARDTLASEPDARLHLSGPWPAYAFAAQWLGGLKERAEA